MQPKGKPTTAGGLLLVQVNVDLGMAQGPTAPVTRGDAPFHHGDGHPGNELLGCQGIWLEVQVGLLEPVRLQLFVWYLGFRDLN
jgi:hypothetical protein